MLALANQVSNWLSVGYADAVICFVAKPEMESLLIVVNGNNFNDRPKETMSSLQWGTLGGSRLTR